MNERQNTDNQSLSVDRRNRPVVENGEYAAFCRRILAAHARRIADGDIDGLAALVTLAGDVDQAIDHAVRGIRAAGYSWTDVANRLGITRQAARQRWAGKVAS
jgi:hypothetical protein